MRRVKIRQVLRSSAMVGEKVCVMGWVRTKRRSKGCAFVALNDGSCHGVLQCVVPSTVTQWDEMPRVMTGVSLRAWGTVVESPGEGQSVELRVTRFEIFGDADSSYPLQKKGHSLEFLRQIAHLRPRTQTMGAVFRLRHRLSHATHEFFHHRGFLWVHTPILTQSDGEGAGEMFQVTTFDLEHPLPRQESGKVDYGQDFFSTKAHLSVTGQLEAEFLALGLSDVYTFGPTFRAENSHTRRHLAEFWMIEPEMAFADLNECIDLAWQHFCYLVRQCLHHCAEELEFFQSAYDHFSVQCFEQWIARKAPHRITYDEALQILAHEAPSLQEPAPQWGQDLASEHESFLTQTYFKAPLCVTDYPQELKAFYMRVNNDGKTVACMDFLVPKAGELIGGSQREERLDVLRQQMKKRRMGKDLRWYQDLRRYGSVVHSGYGMGLERMMLFMSGMENVRDTIAAPRTPGQLMF